MKVKVDIDTRTFVRFWLVVLGFAVAIGGIFLARDALLTIFISLFLALALNPPVSLLAKRLPGKSRVGAIAISYLIVVVLIGSLLFLVIPPITEQTAHFAGTVPTLIDEATSKRSVVDDFINHYSLRSTVNQAIDSAKSQAASASTQFGTILVHIATGAVGSLLRVIFVLILTFFMLLEGPMWIKKIWDLYDDPERLARHKSTIERMYRVVTSFVNGQIIVAAMGGVFVTLTLLIMSLFPSLNLPMNLALPLGVLTFVLELIPMIGSTLAAIVAGLIILLNSPLATLIFVLIYIVYQQIENNIIAPHIQSKGVDLTVLWIILALLLGTSMFGLIGGLISIPVAGCLRIVFVDYLARAKKIRDEHKKPRGLSKLVKKHSSEG